MIKYITLFMVAFLLLGCGVKATSVKVNGQTKQGVTQELKTVTRMTKQPRIMTLPEGFRESKKLKPIDVNVPKTCQEWSDGCNTCSRAKNNQANCTIYTCETKTPFSCLKWQ